MRKWILFRIWKNNTTNRDSHWFFGDNGPPHHYIDSSPALSLYLLALLLPCVRDQQDCPNMSDLLLQWFSCCSFQHHQQHSQVQNARRRHPHHPLKIDRSMIGSPTNFVHTSHIGSTDVELSTRSLHEIQKQMESKGGYGRVQVCRYYLEIILISLTQKRTDHGILSLQAY